MSSSSISDFGQNTWLVEEMYQQYQEDPNSVDPSWHELLKNYEPGDNGGSAPAAAPPSNSAKPTAAKTSASTAAASSSSSLSR